MNTGSVNHGTLLVVGSGPGIGTHVAARFAQGGFRRIILMSRHLRRLGDARLMLRTLIPNASIHTVFVDLSITAGIPQALLEVDRCLGSGSLECVYYNAANVDESPVTATSVERFNRDLQIAVVGLYTVVQWAVPRLLELSDTPRCKPSFLVTCGSFSSEPHPSLIALSVCHAAQQNLMKSFHRHYLAQGLHFGLVTVQGRVHEEAIVASSAGIAESAWMLFSQERREWTFDIEWSQPMRISRILSNGSSTSS